MINYGFFLNTNALYEMLHLKQCRMGEKKHLPNALMETTKHAYVIHNWVQLVM